MMPAMFHSPLPVPTQTFLFPPFLALPSNTSYTATASRNTDDEEGQGKETQTGDRGRILCEQAKEVRNKNEGRENHSPPTITSIAALPISPCLRWVSRPLTATGLYDRSIIITP